MRFGHETDVSVPTAAAILGVSERTLNRLIARGELTHTRIGGRKRLRRAELNQYRERHTFQGERAMPEEENALAD
jgi:excisionase family DNA binding protein